MVAGTRRSSVWAAVTTDVRGSARARSAASSQNLIADASQILGVSWIDGQVLVHAGPSGAERAVEDDRLALR